MLPLLASDHTVNYTRRSFFEKKVDDLNSYKSCITQLFNTMKSVDAAEFTTCIHTCLPVIGLFVAAEFTLSALLQVDILIGKGMQLKHSR